MRRVDIESPEGQRLHAMFMGAVVEVMALALRGAPGRHLEEFAVHVSGTTAPRGMLVHTKVELVDYAAIAARFPHLGVRDVKSLSAPGYMTFVAVAGELMLADSLPIPASLLEVRRRLGVGPVGGTTTSNGVGAPIRPPMGRNASCPCGSGRRFKRCCAA